MLNFFDLFNRLNMAKTSNSYAKDVGKKTSFYEFYPESQNIWTVEDPVSLNCEKNLKRHLL